MPKEHFRAQVAELAAQGDHAGVVAVAHRALLQHCDLDDRVFFRLAYAEHKAALNPFWSIEVVATLQDVLDDLTGQGQPVLEAKVIAGITAALQLENLAYFGELVARFRELRTTETELWGGLILYNAASAYAYHKNLSAAESLYGEAAAISEALYAATGDERHEFVYASAQHNLSRVLLRRGQIGAAIQAYRLGKPGLSKRLPAKCLTREAELALEDANITAVVTLLDDAVRCPEVDSSTKVDVTFVRAKLARVTGNRQAAEAYAREALTGALALARVEAEAEILEFLDQL